jgi:hypothetical protein
VVITKSKVCLKGALHVYLENGVQRFHLLRFPIAKIALLENLGSPQQPFKKLHAPTVHQDIFHLVLDKTISAIVKLAFQVSLQQTMAVPMTARYVLLENTQVTQQQQVNACHVQVDGTKKVLHSQHAKHVYQESDSQIPNRTHVLIVQLEDTVLQSKRSPVKIAMLVSIKPRKDKFYAFRVWLEEHKKVKGCNVVVFVKKASIAAIQMLLMAPVYNALLVGVKERSAL